MKTILLLFIAAAALAQQRAQMIGFVRDPAGETVPDVTVTVLNLDTGIRRIARTNPRGLYAISSLKDGEYKVMVRKSGFRTIARQGIHLDSSQTMRLDFLLEIGRFEEVITVEGNASPVDTNDGSSVTIIDPDTARNLPLHGKGLQGLIEFAPGLIATPAASGDSGQFTAGGQRPTTNYFTVDGVSANNGVSGAGLPGQFSGNSMPGMTAIGSLHGLAGLAEMQEVRVQTSTYSPETGRLPGAQISVTTRSGSNDFHGELFGAFRNSGWNAGDSIANRAGLATDGQNFRNAGATLGGPLRRNRTFFLASGEWLHLRDSAAWRVVTPSTEARALAGPTALTILDLFPKPNGIALTRLTSEHTAQITWPAEVALGSIRVDHGLGDRGLLFTRVAIAPSANQFGYLQAAESKFHSTSVTLGAIYAFSSAVTNDTRLNISRTSVKSWWTTQMQTPFQTPIQTLQAIAIGGVGHIVSGSGGSSLQSQWNLLNTTAVTLGVHRVRFGIDYQRLRPTREVAITGTVDAYPSLESIVSGQPPVTHVTTVPGGSTLLETFSAFALDNWQVTPATNITYGLRWELTPAPSFGLAKPVWKTRYTQFAPRVGVVHRLNQDGTFTLRTGAGLFYDLSFPSAIDPFNGSAYNQWRFLAPVSSPVGDSSFGFPQDLRLPYSVQWSAALERRLPDRTIVAALYAGSAGRSLLRREGVMSAPMAEPAVVNITNNGSSTYHSLQLQVRRPFGRAIEGTFSYAWSHAIDNGSWDSAVFLLYPGTPRDRGSSDFDVRHSAQAGLSYRPSWTHGWTLSGVFRARTGFPIDVVSAENQFGLGFDNASRPDLLSNVPLWISDPGIPGGRRLNPSAFRAALPGRQGTLGRNAIRGFGMAQTDLSLQREFALGETLRMEARMEVYNITNTARFGDPDRYLNSALFGESRSMLNLMLGAGRPSSGLTPAFQSGGPRQLQISLRLRF